MTGRKEGRRHGGWLAEAVMAVLAVQAAAQGGTKQAANQAVDVPAEAAAVKCVIEVSLQDRKLALVEDGKAVKVYPVAVGKPSTPSPVGMFTIERRVVNPTYSHDGLTVAPGPNNPVGTRWMGLSIPGYGIHGTNVPGSIGRAASHGCIRMAKADVEELYPMVQVGDTVEIVGERNEETAQLFGNGANPALAQENTQVATVTAAPAAGTRPAAPAAQQAASAAETLSALMSTALSAAATLTAAGVL